MLAQLPLGESSVMVIVSGVRRVPIISLGRLPEIFVEADVTTVGRFLLFQLQYFLLLDSATRRRGNG